MRRLLTSLEIPAVIAALVATLGAAVPIEREIVHTAGGFRVVPHVVQTGNPPLNWTRFPIGLPKNTRLIGITAGINGNAMWFTNASNDTLNGLPIGGGPLVSYSLMPIVQGAKRVFVPGYVATGSDGRLYMGGCVRIGIHCLPNYVVASTAAGVLTAYGTPGGGPGPLGHLVRGPDGNVWFPDGSGAIAKITPQGVVTEYSIPNGAPVGDVAVGADGNVWFDVNSGSASFALDSVSPRTGFIITYSIGAVFCTGLLGMAPADDGKMYVNCINDYPVYFLTYILAGVGADGSQNVVPNVPGAGTLARGPDGSIWFETALPAGSSPALLPLMGRFDPVAGTITTFQAPFALGSINTIVAGPDGNVWAADQGISPGAMSTIDVYIRNELSVAPSSLSLTVGEKATLTASYTGFAPLSATSSNASVAAVARGTQARTFVVTAVGAGSAIVSVSDTVHNTFNVAVTVSARARTPRHGAQDIHTTTQWIQFKANVPHPMKLRGIVTGPDGVLWYTDSQDSLLVRMTTTGATTSYKLSVVIAGKVHNFSPGLLAVGADGRFYLGGCLLANNQCQRGYFGAATTTGAFTVYKTPSGDYAGYTNRPGLGPDGNVWIPESSHLVKVTPSGALTEYAYPRGVSGVTGAGVAVGVDKNVWFNLPPYQVGKIVPTTGAITAYKLPYASCFDSGDIAAASDGSLYLGCETDVSGGLYKVTTRGVGTFFSNGWGPSFGAITGPDGRAWFFANHDNNDEVGDAVVQRFSAGAAETTTYVSPISGPYFSAIAVGPDGNIWALDQTGFVDVLVLH
jgi:streptogramin lyase